MIEMEFPSFLIEINSVPGMSKGEYCAADVHATKLFNTAEGGACVTKNKDIYHKLKCIRTFGYYEKAASSSDIEMDGLNGKMSEINAALGVVNIKYLKEILDDRKLNINYIKGF